MQTSHAWLHIIMVHLSMELKDNEQLPGPGHMTVKCILTALAAKRLHTGLQCH